MEIIVIGIITTTTIGITVAIGTTTITTPSIEIEKAKQIIYILRKYLMAIVTIVAFKVIKKLTATKRKERKRIKKIEM